MTAESRGEIIAREGESLIEEVANAVTHGVGAVLAVAALVAMLPVQGGYDPDPFRQRGTRGDLPDGFLAGPSRRARSLYARRAALLAGNPARPSYGARNRESKY